MRQRASILIPAMLLALAAQAQLRLVPDAQPPAVFGGGERTLGIRWRNSSEHEVTLEISNCLLQASSATVAPLETAHWKNLTVLPGQTVLESARIDFPVVKAETKFIIQWVGDANQILGVTAVVAYPTNLLGELQILLKDQPFGVLDPDNQIKPLFTQNRVDFIDLGESSLDDFHGRLAILGPFHSKAQQPDGIVRQSKAMMMKGTSVLWFQPPADLHDKLPTLQPSYYSVISGTNAVVVVPPGLVENLPDDPRSQLRLLELCRQALQPEAPTLVEAAAQP